MTGSTFVVFKYCYIAIVFCFLKLLRQIKFVLSDIAFKTLLTIWVRVFLFHRAAAQFTVIMGEGGVGLVFFYIKFVTFVVGYWILEDKSSRYLYQLFFLVFTAVRFVYFFAWYHCFSYESNHEKCDITIYWSWSAGNLSRDINIHPGLHW